MFIRTYLSHVALQRYVKAADSVYNILAKEKGGRGWTGLVAVRRRQFAVKQSNPVAMHHPVSTGNYVLQNLGPYCRPASHPPSSVRLEFGCTTPCRCSTRAAGFSSLQLLSCTEILVPQARLRSLVVSLLFPLSKLTRIHLRSGPRTFRMCVTAGEYES